MTPDFINRSLPSICRIASNGNRYAPLLPEFGAKLPGAGPDGRFTVVLGPSHDPLPAGSPQYRKAATFDAFAKSHEMAKQKFRPTRRSGFSGVKAYI